LDKTSSEKPFVIEKTGKEVKKLDFSKNIRLYSQSNKSAGWNLRK